MVRSGYDMDIIPSDLNTYGGGSEKTSGRFYSQGMRECSLVTVVF